MTLVHVGVDVSGDKQLSRAFEATSREAEDLSEPLGEFGRYMLVQIGEQFRTEGAHGGTPWQRLNRAYEVWKDEAFPGRPMLVRTGRMRAEALSPEAVHVGPRRLVYELDEAAGASYSGPGDTADRGEVALIHQQGRGQQPARPIVQLNQVARRQLDRYFASWLNAVRRHHFGPS